MVRGRGVLSGVYVGVFLIETASCIVVLHIKPNARDRCPLLGSHFE